MSRAFLEHLEEMRNEKCAKPVLLLKREFAEMCAELN